MKRFLSVVLALVMVLSLASVAVAEETSKPHKVGIAFSGWSSNPNWLMVSEQLHSKYDDKGFTFLEKDASSADDIPTAVENFVSAGCDIVVIHGLFSDAVQAMMPSMVEAGIAVGVVDADLMADGATYDMMCAEYDTGYAMGKAAAEWANENIEGTVHAGVLGYEILEAFALRGRGIRDALNEYLKDGQVEILLSAVDQETGMTETENMLSAVPELNLVACWNSGAGVGSYEALKAAGWGAEGKALFSIDATDDELKGILEGGCYKGAMGMDLRNQWLGLFEKLVAYADNDFTYPEGTTEEDKFWNYPLNMIYADTAADYLSK